MCQHIDSTRRDQRIKRDWENKLFVVNCFCIYGHKRCVLSMACACNSPECKGVDLDSVWRYDYRNHFDFKTNRNCLKFIIESKIARNKFCLNEFISFLLTQSDRRFKFRF